MPRLIAPLLIAAACAAAPATWAGDALMVGPVFGQLVTTPAPEGFVQGYEATQGPSYIREMIPKGESVEDWSQMVTLTGALGAARSASQGATTDAARAFAGQIATGYRNACPDSFTALGFKPPQVPGARTVFAGFLGCGMTPGVRQSETTLLLVLVGAEDIYTLQWAEHGPATSTPPAFDVAHWKDRYHRLVAGARLCDIVPGEAPPYPSCTGG